LITSRAPLGAAVHAADEIPPALHREGRQRAADDVVIRTPRPGELGWLISERQGRVQREEDYERYGKARTCIG
jgi:hypothetical protein